MNNSRCGGTLLKPGDRLEVSRSLPNLLRYLIGK